MLCKGGEGAAHVLEAAFAEKAAASRARGPQQQKRRNPEGQERVNVKCFANTSPCMSEHMTMVCCSKPLGGDHAD